MAETAETIDRDYVDNYSFKELAVEHIMPNFFPDMDQESLVTGQTGMVAELLGTITEDTFNTGSSLMAEVFPSRAKMESSIYSNASVFQLTNAFAEASLRELDKLTSSAAVEVMETTDMPIISSTSVILDMMRQQNVA